MKYIIRFIALAAGLWLADYLMSSVMIKDTQTLLIAAGVLLLINTLVKPILHALTLPINIITLGLFGMVLNVVLFWFGQLLVDGFTIVGTLPVLGAAIVTFFVYNMIGGTDE